MNAIDSFTGLLKGKRIFLSASIPSPERSNHYKRQDDAPWRIRDAVTSVIHAVFAAGGQLVFGGHPMISPLVLLIAGEHFAPSDGEAERPITVYQSRAFESDLTVETELLEQLGYAEIRLIEISEDENPLSARRPESKSLLLMRRRMLEDRGLDAAVMIGGMEGIEEEYRLARMRDLQTFLLPTTGGAAAILAMLERDQGTRFIDEVVRDEINGVLQSNREGIPSDQENLIPRTFVSYPLVAQELVRQIAGGLNQRTALEGA